MRSMLNNFLFLLSLITNLASTQTLSPDKLPAIVLSENDVSQPEMNIKKDDSDWYILPDGSNLVCDKKTSTICHPFEFEPESDWKEILPLQVIPTGLDIRMNIYKGLKEAKLRDLNLSEEEINEDESENLADLHEFSTFFEKLIKDETVEETLEDLIDYSHDLMHGSKIIQKEQNFIVSKLKDTTVNDKAKDLYLRLITSCLRNNPPAKEMLFIKNVDFIINIIPTWINQDKQLLLKRCINILQNVAYKSTANSNLIDNLELLYSSTSFIENKVKILEILSDLELLCTSDEEDQVNFHFNPHHKSIVKRNEDNKVNLKAWFNEYCDKIQLEFLDDFYLSKFLKTLVKFKEFDNDLKPKTDFMKWIAEQSMSRFNELEENKNIDLVSRDVEKELFNKEFIKIRHEVFGNKMASRIKTPLDEL
ncbi:hypothetical protein QEN19_000577 [Hanseniaspora menglaensis]